MPKSGKCPACEKQVEYPEPGEKCPSENCNYDLGDWAENWREGVAESFGLDPEDVV